MRLKFTGREKNNIEDWFKTNRPHWKKAQWSAIFLSLYNSNRMDTEKNFTHNEYEKCKKCMTFFGC